MVLGNSRSNSRRTETEDFIIRKSETILVVAGGSRNCRDMDQRI